MQFTPFARIAPGQDGAIHDHLLFRFDNDAMASVYDLTKAAPDTPLDPLCVFPLDNRAFVCPHSNASVFGPQRFEPEDPLPLLYTNVYNTYAREADRREGQLCVYRIFRDDAQFSSKLVQLIQIGFTADPLWCADGKLLRPYGNFAIDAEHGLLYAFVMQEANQCTRYFVFNLPAPHAGIEEDGLRRVVLTPADILATFDCPYQHFIQGACVHAGLLYSLEGFTNDPNNPPAIRIIDLAARQEIRHIHLQELGLTHEPELIDFCGDACLYGDRPGNVFRVEE